MPAVAFDTLRAKQALTAAGFPENQADAVVVMTGDALTEGVATKLDIGDLKGDISRLDAKIDSTAAQHRGDFKSEIAQLEVKLDGKIDKTAAQLRGDFRSDIAQLEVKLDKTAAQLRGDFKSDIAQLDGKIDKTAAQLRGDFKSDIAQLDGKIDKTADLLRGEIKSESAKIEAKIDARISGLESKILRIATALGAGTATVGLVAILVKLL